mgnify:CR=1 FL=1
MKTSTCHHGHLRCCSPFVAVGLVKSRLTRQHLVDDHTQGPQVHSVVVAVPQDQLWVTLLKACQPP